MLRWEYPLDAWGDVPLRTQLSVDQLERMTVLAWVEKFRTAPVLAYPFYVTPGHHLHGALALHLQVCPLCLQEQPYIRLLWRLVPVHACLRHRCLLQTHCYRCGGLLSVIGPEQRHLRCPVCDADLRQPPVEAASHEVLIKQQRRQADLQFLLDPETTLLNQRDLENGVVVDDLCKAIGLKFRYLRMTTGLSTIEMGRQLNMSRATVSLLETGRAALLSTYWTYLEQLSWTWVEFAALDIPREFVRNPSQTRHLHLRICPTPECLSHRPSPSTQVRITGDWPDRQKVRLRCTACGRTFFRSYDGELILRPENQPSQPAERRHLRKSPEEVALLTQLSLQGEDTCKIAERLGWAPATVKRHWIRLGIEEQALQARAQRRERQQQQDLAIYHERLEAVFQSLLKQDREISLRDVSRAMGYKAGGRNIDPDKRKRMQQVIQAHNLQVRQRRYERLAARISEILDELKHSDQAMTILEISQRLGLHNRTLQVRYPELHAIVRQAIQEQKTRIKALRKERWRIQIEEATARLIEQGKKPTGNAIAREAGLNTSHAYSNLTIRSLIQQWTDRFS